MNGNVFFFRASLGTEYICSFRWHKFWRRFRLDTFPRCGLALAMALVEPVIKSCPVFKFVQMGPTETRLLSNLNSLQMKLTTLKKLAKKSNRIWKLIWSRATCDVLNEALIRGRVDQWILIPTWFSHLKRLLSSRRIHNFHSVCNGIKILSLLINPLHSTPLSPLGAK